MADIREDGSEVFHFDIPDFPISIRHNYIPANIKLTDISIHWHEEVEITYVVSGTISHQLNGKRVQLKAGEAIYINSRQLHLIEPDPSDCELYCLIFSPMVLCSSNHIAKKYVAPIVNNENLDYFFLNESDDKQRRVLDKILKIHKLQSETEFEMKTMTALYDLWLDLCEILPKAKTDEGIINEDLHKVQQMLSLIQKSYSKDLELEDICNAGGVGKTKGTQLFCEYLNMTPIDYLINYRLEIASHMLAKTKNSVLSIALDTGFSDSSYFARVFRKRIGVSPLEYRKKNKKE